ncbi:hypothetical protein [Desulfofundulus thermosubterraneus]|uniref:hypothetical protein n=1 Tax=Desulfofundulus thermosubterraneus TaxID=348840 RepID=UPI000932EAFF|nr:hypothetical protein [Desulfofundulus thermosubterraneus]
MKFDKIKPGVLFRTPWGKERLFYKIPDPQPWEDAGPCHACGTIAVWNARAVETDQLVHFCRDEEVVPVKVGQ